MYLGPQHFQLQRQYFEDAIHFAACSLWYQPYGLLGCAIDEEALRNGTLALLHARGIFPDGLPLLMPECDALPPVRPIAELFPPTRDRLAVLLAIRPRVSNGLNCAVSPQGTDTRFRAESRNLCDETTGSDEREVQFARKNIRLLLDIEAADDMVTLPVARVMRDGAGHLVLDPHFIPPCLQISASERLMLLLQRLLEILQEKSLSLGRSSREPRPSGEFSGRDVASFWLLHAVNSALAPLRHLSVSKRSHPEELFMELSRLAGALCTFALHSTPQSLPTYDHERLTECFDALDRHIRTHLETIVPSNYTSITLEKVAENFYEGEIVDPRCLDRARWIFGIRSNTSEVELITKVPQLVKICSAKFVSELVKRAMAGLPLIHLPVPPAAIPAQLEAQYFGVTRSGPFWDNIVQTRRVGVYVPGEFPGPELELLVISEA
jgi:type VI secretion system protein ImpJ